MKTRMRFVKTGSVKYIGHLDCMRFFQKALRRAGLDVAYTNGFSPHQKMSFASPLGVGLTSDGEYLDVEFHTLPDMGKEDFLAFLNRYMTDEIFVRDIEYMPEDFKNSMSLLRAADYMLIEKEEGVFPEGWREKWRGFLSQKEIPVMKETKKSRQMTDIRPLILGDAFSLEDFSGLTGEDYGEIHCEFRRGEKLFLRLASGSERNLKPELVMETFARYSGMTWRPRAVQTHRLQMYFAAKRGDELA